VGNTAVLDDAVGDSIAAMQPPDASAAANRSEFLPGNFVTLADGSKCDLAGRTPSDLLRLQFEQEQQFARKFVETPKGSAERAAAFCQGYDTITAIFAAVNGLTGKPTVMGLDRRYEQLVVGLLDAQRHRGMTPRLFEVGFGGGVLLARVAQAGFAVGGIEVSAAMYREATAMLASCGGLASEAVGDRHALLLGDFMTSGLSAVRERVTVCYWNDVFEHIPPDEIEDYLRRIYELLAPGGSLVTITPNWHLRPMDVTGEFFPKRTQARGVHLREYTLGEVTTLLRRAGFCKVRTPLFVTRGKLAMVGNGLAGVKRICEPLLEWLPFPVTRLLVRGLGLSVTIAERR
jgi:SAM-dependent methyltransferase